VVPVDCVGDHAAVPHAHFVLLFVLEWTTSNFANELFTLGSCPHEFFVLIIEVIE
jgi:hypothetical protein